MHSALASRLRVEGGAQQLSCPPAVRSAGARLRGWVPALWARQRGTRAEGTAATLGRLRHCSLPADTAASGSHASVRPCAVVTCSRDAQGCTWSFRMYRPPAIRLVRTPPNTPSQKNQSKKLQFQRIGGSLVTVSQSGAPAGQLVRRCLVVAWAFGHPARCHSLGLIESTKLPLHSRVRATRRP